MRLVVMKESRLTVERGPRSVPPPEMVNLLVGLSVSSPGARPAGLPH